MIVGGLGSGESLGEGYLGLAIVYDVLDILRRRSYHIGLAIEFEET